jgi:mRNA interferase MazF
VRTALCLTDPIGEQNHVTVAYITSTDLGEQYDLPLNPARRGLKEIGLSKPAVIRLSQLMTIPADQIKSEFGRVPPEIRDEAYNTLVAIFSRELPQARF